MFKKFANKGLWKMFCLKIKSICIKKEIIYKQLKKFLLEAIQIRKYYFVLKKGKKILSVFIKLSYIGKCNESNCKKVSFFVEVWLVELELEFGTFRVFFRYFSIAQLQQLVVVF